MKYMEEILGRVCRVMGEYERDRAPVEDGYNIFRVLDVADKEVMVCRMLADIVDPAGGHGQGDRFLRTFVEKVLGLSAGEEFFHEAEVIREYRIPESFSGRRNRRIDLVIRSKDWFIPIEVKIKADDQEAQCCDYYCFAAEQMNRERAKVYYVTKEGTFPEEWSMTAKREADGLMETVPADGLIRLSIRRDICGWLRGVVEELEEGRFKSVCSQYLDVMEDMTGAMGYEEALLVEEIILQDSSTFKAGLWIEQTMEQAKIKLMTRLMEELREGMRPLLETYGLRELGPRSYYSVERQIGQYYACGDTSYPGVNYGLEHGRLADGKELWLRIEIDWSLFAGFCLFDPRARDGEGDQVDHMEAWKEEIAGFFKDMEEVDNDDWWILWCYLPSGDHSMGKGQLLCPEFKSFNKAAVKLADEGHRRDMVQRYVSVIEEKLLMRLK